MIGSGEPDAVGVQSRRRRRRRRDDCLGRQAGAPHVRTRGIRCIGTTSARASSRSEELAVAMRQKQRCSGASSHAVRWRSPTSAGSSGAGCRIAGVSRRDFRRPRRRTARARDRGRAIGGASKHRRVSAFASASLPRTPRRRCRRPGCGLAPSPPRGGPDPRRRPRPRPRHRRRSRSQMGRKCSRGC